MTKASTRFGAATILSVVLIGCAGGGQPTPSPTVAPTAPAAPTIAPTATPSPSPMASAPLVDGLPPDGTWQVDLTTDELVAAGWPEDVTPAGTYTWTFADGRAILVVAYDDGSDDHCEADMSLVEGHVQLAYAGFGCGDERDVISWDLAPDGLHLFIISTTAPFDQQKAYLETEPWQPAEPSVPTTSPGSSVSESTLVYVALGDSLLYALDTDCDGCTSAAVLYGEQMSSDLGVSVEVHNLTMHNGLSSAGLRQYLEQGAKIGRTGEDVWKAVAAADVVSVTIGFNDFPQLPSEPTLQLDTFRTNLDLILGRIDGLRAGEPTIVRVTEIYNNGGPAWTHILEAQNEIICDVAAHHHAICVDIYHAFNGADGSASPGALGYLGEDQTHPSQLGMDVIADALTATGYAPLD